jgi:hypothetical protein
MSRDLSRQEAVDGHVHSTRLALSFAADLAQAWGNTIGGIR